MASRPAFAALGCLQCRSRVLRAITSNSNAILRAPALATTAPLRPRNLHRAFSSLPPDAPKPTGESVAPEVQPEAQDSEVKTQTSEVTEEKNAGDETPWFLQVEPPTHAPTQHVSPLPELPDASPAILEPLMKYVYEEMGLDDLSLLDLRAMDPPPALGPNLLMLFATARSERHLHVSSSRLVKWLRYAHRIESNADGLIGPGELKTKLRRMRRKAKLLGSSAMVTPGGDDGITTGWICINLGTLGATYGEAAHFDAEGKMSGFGAPVTGTTIVVQVMTQARRTELDLERLWSQQLTRSVVQNKKLTEGAKFQHRFGQLPPTTDRSSKGGAATPGQKRAFSTSLKRPMPFAPAPSTKPASTKPAHSENSGVDHVSLLSMSLPEIRQQLEQIRWEGKQVDRDSCLHLLKQIFRAVSSDENHARTQADLATELIETMNERGMSIMDTEVIITIIEAISHSGARGEKIEMIQSNLELVLRRGTQCCPSEEQLMRLMRAYASQGNWERFWDTWRIPPRYSKRRGPELYVFVYSLMARTSDKVKCMDTLRKCLDEMLAEEPPVLPTEPVWLAVKQCIRVADPGAIDVAEHMVSRGARDGNKPPSMEFVRMLKELEALRRNM
ncbi:ATPase synthesis protein mitochondrial [Colletotrichum truncatum]|uniref:ATPase synthesis protein mitochondrial n=1 Tax=Colletotrichum truncatum TaxID=5467 RepID=A0ACC3YEL8_COLTU|nr:ATPase synthesis protein mitochondrial [Colletotrichum truncatum]KAF6783259.1 ATPase synthesis protein mitochondrial [Colletotrichum truncatum]